jgi:thiol-disulfide isomerase/thioredoxin
MKSQYKILFTLLVFCSVILACSLFTGSDVIQVNQPAPDFILTTLGGREVQLSQFRGTPVLINFWATWCKPCIQEMPLIQERFESNFPNLAILAIEDGSSQQEIHAVGRKVQTTFLILRGTNQVLDLYRIRAFPTTYFVDAEGVIRAQHVGGLSASQLDTELAKILP